MCRVLSVPFVLAALLALVMPGSRVERVVAEPAPKEKESPAVKKLKEQRVELLKHALQGSIARWQHERNAPGPEYILKIARRLRKAERSLATRPEEHRAAELAYFRLVCEMDHFTVSAYEQGETVSRSEASLTRATRISAEIDLRQAGGTPPRDVKPAREIKDRRGRD